MFVEEIMEGPHEMFILVACSIFFLFYYTYNQIGLFLVFNSLH